MRKLPAVMLAIGSIAACTHPAPSRGPGVVTGAAPPVPAALDAEVRAAPEVTYAAITKDQACRMTPGKTGGVIGIPEPYRRVDGTCDDGMCDWVEKPPKGADSCFVANTNIVRAERESRGARGEASAAGKGTRYLDRVESHLHLDTRESAALRQNGFVVMERQRYGSYAVAFHDVFQQQLPVYVSADAILNAVYQSTQTLLQSAERTRLIPRLVKMLPRMRATLARTKGIYTAEEVADLGMYLYVAEGLLDPQLKEKLDGGSLLASARTSEALEEVELFGRSRMIDFTQLTPRGYYASAPPAEVRKADGTTDYVQFASYFRAMMWLSRVEMNLVSRSCRSSQPGAAVDPTETPREARDALALADLVRRSGSLADLEEIEKVYGVFAGGREDVTVPDLLSFGIAPSDPDGPQKLRAKIGDLFQRTARVHYMPEGAKVLPAIATLFGPRITPDTAPLTGLVHDAIPDRLVLGAADVAYVLGHDRAKAYLAKDIAEHPSLASALDLSRAALAGRVGAKKDVYATWLRAITALAKPSPGTTPTFMHGDAFADARMSSSLTGYAQLRHTFVLLAGQGYDSYGCEIPDGWVEPALGMYDALLAWVVSARAAAPDEKPYFDRVDAVLGMLRTIARTELDGAPLSEPQRRWLGMIAEYTPVGGSFGDSGEPPKYTGWYFDLFPDREIGAQRHVDLVADYVTLTNANQVRYLGVDRAALGVFIVDTSGPPRAMVGPVSIPYETSTPITKRLDDTTARQTPHPRAPWLGYAVPEGPEPTLDAQVFACGTDARVVVRAPSALGDVAIELLDHHGDVMAPAVTLPVGRDPAVFAFAVPKAILDSPRGIEGFHVKVLASGYDVVSGVGGYAAYDPEIESTDVYRRTREQLQLGRMATRIDPTPADQEMPPVPMPVP